MAARLLILSITLSACLAQLCLPAAWQAFETVYTNSPNPQQENSAFMRFRDMNQQAERFDFMMFQDHSQRQAYQVLNFATGFSYFVEEQMGQPVSCTLQKLNGPMNTECLFTKSEIKRQ
jgi:hypothetical protein